jgi:acyl-CoA thioesterase II
MSAYPDLATILQPEQLELNLFRGQVPQVGWKRVYGGLVVAQALAAACRTVEALLPHSLHCYFLLGGDPSMPIVYDVDRIRDGGSFSTRRVVAIQNGRAIFALSASFHRLEEGLSHQTRMPVAPRPHQLPSWDELRRTVFPRLPAHVRGYFERERPIELMPLDFERYIDPGRGPGDGRCWMRARRALPADQALHRVVLAYASDMNIVEMALAPHGKSVFSADMMMASLDHAMWFHRDVKADEWLLYDLDSPSAGAARGFARGQFFA